MNIQLDNWKVTNLNFNNSEENKNEERSFNLKVNHYFPSEISKTFELEFVIEIYDINFDIALEMLFLFETEAEITENFKLSNFPKINAPAIAFPYVRAFISNFTLQAGFEPIILPSINFVKLAGEIETKDK